MEQSISIITPAFNNGNALDLTISTLRNQNFSDFEYIVIDGGSNDNTIDIILKNSDIITYWISEPDSGIYYAINKGINYSKGGIIGILGAGDYYEDGVLEFICSSFKENPSVQIIYGNTNLIYSKGEKKGITSHKSIKRLKKSLIGCHQSIFIRKSAYSELGLYDTTFRIVSDYEFLARCYVNNIAILYINRTFSNFQLDGISSGKSSLLQIVENHKVRKLYNFYAIIDLYYYYQLIRNLLLIILKTLITKRIFNRLRYYYNFSRNG